MHEADIPERPRLSAFRGKRHGGANPTLVSHTDAWWYKDGKWEQINRTEAGSSAAVIGEKAFTERFGHLPPLPATAFQLDGKRTEALVAAEPKHNIPDDHFENEPGPVDTARLSPEAQKAFDDKLKEIARKKKQDTERS